MDRLSEADLHAIETELGRRIVAEYGLELSGLVLDMMNFATYIDSGNDKAPIARGRHLRARPAVAILAQRVRRAQRRSRVMAGCALKSLRSSPSAYAGRSPRS